MSGGYVWVDKNYKTYTVDKIGDRHLKNILRLLCNGGGYYEHLDEERIAKLFDEAARRKIDHPYKLEGAIQRYRDRGVFEELRYLDAIFGVEDF